MTDRQSGPCCAHSRVSWRTKQIEGGLTTGWWECDSGCGMRFTTVPHAASLPPLGEPDASDLPALARTELERLAEWLENPTEALADRCNPHRIAATIRGILQQPRCPRCGAASLMRAADLPGPLDYFERVAQFLERDGLGDWAAEFRRELQDALVAARRAGEARSMEPPWPFDRTMAWIHQQPAYRDAPAPSKAMPWPRCLVQIIGQLLAARPALDISTELRRIASWIRTPGNIDREDAKDDGARS